MISSLFYVVLCVVVGIGISIQAAANAALGKATLPSFAALMSFVIGLVPIFIYFAVESKGFSEGNYENAKWWHFIGGVLGAAYIFVIIITVPRLGAATVLSATIAGQVFLGLILDHFGFLGVQQRIASLGRIFATILIIIGAVLMSIF